MQEKRANLLQIVKHYFDISHETCGDWCGKKKDPNYIPNSMPNGKWLSDVIVTNILNDGSTTCRSLLIDVQNVVESYASIELLEKVDVDVS